MFSPLRSMEFPPTFPPATTFRIHTAQCQLQGFRGEDRCSWVVTLQGAHLGARIYPGTAPSGDARVRGRAAQRLEREGWRGSGR